MKDTSLDADLLLHAYRAGIFPMAERQDDPEIFWVDPRRRGILPLDGFYLSRSLTKRLRRVDYSVTLNNAFGAVIEGCADRPETWINDPIRVLYQDLFERGHAHSLEIWMDGELAGGVYGVVIGRAFCGESMFSRRRDASKLALAWMVDLLSRSGGTLFDTQFITPHLETLGAIEITRSAYRRRLAEALTGDMDLNATSLAATGQDVVQRITQMS